MILSTKNLYNYLKIKISLEMTLSGKLQQFKDRVISQLSAADIALMEEGTMRLSRSGMAGRNFVCLPGAMSLFWLINSAE
jgi:hypothetical protein